VVSIEILISSPLLSTVGLFNAAVRHPAVCGTDIDVKILSTDLDAYNMMTHSTQWYYIKVTVIKKNEEKTIGNVKLNSTNLLYIGGIRILDIESSFGYLTNHYTLLNSLPKDICGIDASTNNVNYA